MNLKQLWAMFASPETVTIDLLFIAIVALTLLIDRVGQTLPAGLLLILLFLIYLAKIYAEKLYRNPFVLLFMGITFIIVFSYSYIIFFI